MDVCGNDTIFIPSDECDECEALLARIENTYTKAEVDYMLSELEHVQMKEVSVLPSTGEDNVLYLIPRSGGGYEMYVWATDHWVDLGQEEIDLSEYVKTTQLNTATEDGLVLKGAGQANKVWKTDADGVPDWRNDDNYKRWSKTVAFAGNTTFTIPAGAREAVIWVCFPEGTWVDMTVYLSDFTSERPVLNGFYYSASYYGCVGVLCPPGTRTVSLSNSWTRMHHNGTTYTRNDMTYHVYYR